MNPLTVAHWVDILKKLVDRALAQGAKLDAWGMDLGLENKLIRPEKRQPELCLLSCAGLDANGGETYLQAAQYQLGLELSQLRAIEYGFMYGIEEATGVDSTYLKIGKTVADYYIAKGLYQYN